MSFFLETPQLETKCDVDDTGETENEDYDEKLMMQGKSRNRYGDCYATSNLERRILLC
jgi:hypothetical protein